MNTLLKIKEEIAKAVRRELNLSANQLSSTQLVSPPNSQLGDLSLALFDLAKESKKNPVELAKELAEKPSFQKGSLGKILTVNPTGPYLNFKIEPQYLAQEVLGKIEKNKDDYGKNKKLRGQKIMVEYAQPNPFKAFHIGHLRGTVLGESICQLLEAQGAKVIRTNYQGDVGMHIAKCLWAFQKIDPQDYPAKSDEKVALIGRCYAEGAEAFEKSETVQKDIKKINKLIYTRESEKINQLWERGKTWSLEKFAEIFWRLGTRFDRQYMESEVMEDGLKYVKKALQKGILEENDGAVIFRGDPHNLDTRVFLNSQGLPTYEGKELGLAHQEFSDFGRLDLCIHNVAEEQISFFQVTFKVEELLNPKKFKNKQYHNAYGFVGLKSGKMSSRKGQVVLGQKILDEAVVEVKKICGDRKCSPATAEIIGVGAVKYGLLKVGAKKYLAFDMKESVSFEGDSGPYLQYTYARIQSILRKAKEKKISFQKDSVLHLTEPIEHQLILQLAKYPEVLEKSAEKYDPSKVANYLFDLAQMFNDYYHAVPILKADEKVKLARLALIVSVAQVVKNGLKILGIDVVSKM